MKKNHQFLIAIGMALLLPATLLVVMAKTDGGQSTLPRPEGPCDIYAEDGCPCSAAHSTTRALYAAYNGPLYQVMRLSDGKTLDIGVVPAGANDPGGYADAAAQDAFCAHTYCWITTVYDQSGYNNHLVQAPRGAFQGPAMGGFNNLPMADMAPVTLMDHKVYGVFIAPDMGLRWNDAKGTAVDDQAEGQYWVINGNHFNDGCCFDYGNAETDSRDDGDGTMETTYYGNASLWYYGQDAGPWIMTDQENNLVGCVNPSPNDRYCADLPSIPWRFVTATADGEPHRWRAMGGNAQQGDLAIMFDGTRIINDRNSYDPMRKQGAIVLGNGGDNNNYSQGTFYEGAMTVAGTFPSEKACQKIQANIVKAGYDLPRVIVAPSSSVDAPQGLQTFAPKQSQHTTVTFTNTTGVPINALTLSLEVPKGWQSVVSGSKATVMAFSKPVQPLATVHATFNVTSGTKPFNGDLVGKAIWSDAGRTRTETGLQKVRNVSAIKINEFRIGAGENLTNTFIELYNAGDKAIDLSNWTLTQHANQLPHFSTIAIPAGTKLAANEFYLLGLSTSGLAVPANKGASTVYLRSVAGMKVGDVVEIGTGSSKELRTITALVQPEKPAQDPAPARGGWGRRPVDPAAFTTIWQPLPDGPVITIPKGSTTIPVERVEQFKVGQQMAIGYGATYPTVALAQERYEVVTITKVGKPGTQAWLSMDAKAGDTNIKVSSVENISVGDKIRLDIDTKDHGIEWVTVKRVGTASSRNTFMGPLTDRDDPGTGLELETPLKFDHASNMPFSARGTGISFEPATAFEHSSNEPVLPLCYAITLDKPLAKAHAIDDVVRDEQVLTAGYQGTVQPHQWFGGPALSLLSGSMVLRDAKGLVVDGLNYGELVDPWLSEGYQAVSGAGQLGCYVPSPGVSGGSSRPGANPTSLPDRSVGRYPDGLDKDINCNDFHLHQTLRLAAPAAAGTDNVKVSSVAGLSIGQVVRLGMGSDCETVTIATIGTAGNTVVTTAAAAGTTVVPVQRTEGFRVGQKITVGSGSNRETATVAAVTNRRFRFGAPNPTPNDGPTTFITLNAPLKKAHAVDEQVAGTGITFSSPLKKAHNIGDYMANNVPTPGAPNQY